MRVTRTHFRDVNMGGELLARDRKNPGRSQAGGGGWRPVRCWENDGEAAAQATRCTRGEIGLIGTFGPRLVTYLLNWRAGRLVGWSGCGGEGE